MYNTVVPTCKQTYQGFLNRSSSLSLYQWHSSNGCNIIFGGDRSNLHRESVTLWLRVAEVLTERIQQWDLSLLEWNHLSLIRTTSLFLKSHGRQVSAYANQLNIPNVEINSWGQSTLVNSKLSPNSTSISKTFSQMWLKFPWRQYQYFFTHTS